MFAFDVNKVYMLSISFLEKNSVVNAVVPGKNLEEMIREYKEFYPDFKKIVVYEADTKEAIGIVRNNQ